MLEAREAILKDRFYHSHETDWYDVCERAARTWTHSLEFTGEAYAMMRNRLALPNTPALANAGRKHPMGSACFVLPIDDSLVNDDDNPASIMQTLMDAAAVHKSGGGTGFSFGRIRPAGALVGSTGRDAPGPVNVLELYSDALNRVTQAGMRPGANMGIIPCDHPDVLSFIAAKRGEKQVRNFNISVAVTDDFMRAVEDGDPWADRVWAAIINGAYENGEPGLFFIDTTNRARMHPEKIECTNPCGEVPLRPYEACVLGSINLAEHVTPDGVEWDKLYQTTRTLLTLLDNVIEDQAYPLPIIEQEQKRYRKIGVGVMGFAEMLVKLGVKYTDPEAIDIAHQFMSAIRQECYWWSCILAQTRGPYDGWSKLAGLPRRRNLMTNVIAPTGTIARLAMTPGFGIEPFFDVDENGTWYSFVCGGVFPSVNEWHTHPAFVTAKDVPWEQHVRIQAAFQKYTDQAVSKTLNLPNSATRLDIERAYIAAWQSGCKGITVLREGSREETVISTDCKEGACPL